ncbi:prolyl oligopeptidase family serine peptidase [Halorubrum ezzemoulense]|uniref:prolyl oligopeptidase family serine peptidase n=1 Tax=Halorubrum ezzemoulense TaxID=337243 RepID=UPI003CCDC424
MKPHGGPTAFDGFGFDHRAAYFAALGYAVVRPNYRGSDGFGRAFRMANDGDWGGGDLDDVIRAADATAARYDAVDVDRVDVCPAARGGGHGEPVARVVPLGRRDLGLRDAVDRRRRVAPVGRGFVAADAVHRVVSAAVVDERDRLVVAGSRARTGRPDARFGEQFGDGPAAVATEWDADERGLVVEQVGVCRARRDDAVALPVRVGVEVLAGRDRLDPVAVGGDDREARPREGVGDDRDPGLAPREAGDAALQVGQHLDRAGVGVDGRQLGVAGDEGDPVAVGAPVEPPRVGAPVAHGRRPPAREPAVLAVGRQPDVGGQLAVLRVRDPPVGSDRGLDNAVCDGHVGEQPVVVGVSEVSSVHACHCGERALVRMAPGRGSSRDVGLVITAQLNPLPLRVR